MHNVITRLSVFGTYAVHMNMDELQCTFHSVGFEVQEDENVYSTWGVYTMY